MQMNLGEIRHGTVSHYPFLLYLHNHSYDVIWTDKLWFAKQFHTLGHIVVYANHSLTGLYVTANCVYPWIWKEKETKP